MAVDGLGKGTAVLCVVYNGEYQQLPEGVAEELGRMGAKTVMPEDEWGNEAPLWPAVASAVTSHPAFSSFQKIVVVSSGKDLLDIAMREEIFTGAIGKWREGGKRVDLYRADKGFWIDGLDKLFNHVEHVTPHLCKPIQMLTSCNPMAAG
jgi:hypothetical protein